MARVEVDPPPHSLAGSADNPGDPWKSSRGDRAGVIEREIAGDEDVLIAAARLIVSHAPITTWPDDVRAAYDLAIDDTRALLADRWQIIALRRHLFGGDVGPEGSALDRASSIGQIHCDEVLGDNPTTRRRAERLRDGLCSLVPFRSGRYLLG